MIEPPPWPRHRPRWRKPGSKYRGGLKLKAGPAVETAIANSAARLEAARARMRRNETQPGAHAYNRAFRRCGRGSAHEYRRLRHPGAVCAT